MFAFASSVAASSNSPPWWAVSVLAGSFTVLGAALSQGTTFLLDVLGQNAKMPLGGMLRIEAGVATYLHPWMRCSVGLRTFED